jgi:hypothetical protein
MDLIMEKSTFQQYYLLQSILLHHTTFQILNYLSVTE